MLEAHGVGRVDVPGVDAEELDALGAVLLGDLLEVRPSARHGPHQEPQMFRTTILPLKSESETGLPSSDLPVTSGAAVRLPGLAVAMPPCR
ncbi:hypothetical protein GCM10025734_39200 [Kitasatospora paranensis]